MTKYRATATHSNSLTRQQEGFCLFVVAGNNLSDAYRKTFTCGGMKAKTVNEKASRLMAKGKVRARVELMAPVIAEAQMNRTEWLQWLTKCCRFDPRKLFDATGKPTPITELAPNEAAAIQQYELHAESPAPDGSRKAFTVKIKFSDRLSALALLGKACHWHADRREGTGEPEGGAMHKNIVVDFVKPSMSQEEAYRRMVTGP